MAPQDLRVVAVASFIPAFALLLAHGIVSHSPVPATGLAPLFFSSSFCFFILRRRKRRARATTLGSTTDGERQPLLREEATHDATPSSDAPAVTANADDEVQAVRDYEETSLEGIHDRFPILVFFCDIILAGAIMTVLVFTWLHSSQQNGQLAMLAAYGTIPLLVNFSIHLLFAVRGLSSGLALPELTRYAAWQLVPGDCPDCGHHLRPEHGPDIPWFQSVGRTINSAREREWKWKFPSPTPGSWLSVPEWLTWPVRDREEDDEEQRDAEESRDRSAEQSRSSKMPPWLRRPTWLSYGSTDTPQGRGENGDDDDEEARLFVDRDASAYRDDEDEQQHATHDRVKGPRGVVPASTEAVVVVGKKKQRKISSSSNVETDEPSW